MTLTRGEDCGLAELVPAMSTNQNITANDVAQITKNAEPCKIEAMVWRSIARNALGEQEANSIYQNAIGDVMANIDRSATNTEDDDNADLAGFKSFEEFLETQNAEKIQPEDDGAPVDYGDYLEANEGKQLKEIDGDLYLEGDEDE